MVKRKAADLGISMAEYIRRLVERDLGGANGQVDISAIVALGDSGVSDIAADCRRATAEAVEAHWKQRTR